MFCIWCFDCYLFLSVFFGLNIFRNLNVLYFGFGWRLLRLSVCLNFWMFTVSVGLGCISRFLLGDLVFFICFLAGWFPAILMIWCFGFICGSIRFGYFDFENFCVLLSCCDFGFGG